MVFFGTKNGGCALDDDNNYTIDSRVASIGACVFLGKVIRFDGIGSYTVYTLAGKRDLVNKTEYSTLGPDGAKIGIVPQLTVNNTNRWLVKAMQKPVSNFSTMFGYVYVPQGGSYKLQLANYHMDANTTDTEAIDAIRKYSNYVPHSITNPEGYLDNDSSNNRICFQGPNDEKSMIEVGGDGKNFSTRAELDTILC